MNINNDRFNFFGINFYNGNYSNLRNSLLQGGLLVAPSGPGLSSILEDNDYVNSLKSADFVLLDSGLFCILVKIFLKRKIYKFSGYKFLYNFFNDKGLISNKKILKIEPSEYESLINSKLLNNKFKKIYSYISPMYNKENINDTQLLSLIKNLKPDIILINLGGGIQEILGKTIKDYNSANQSLIICTGAAISFFTKSQAPINKIIDDLYLGWLFRIIYNPKIFLKRYILAIKLIGVFFKIKYKNLNDN